MRYPWARCSDTASRTYGIRMSRGDHAVGGDESATASVEGGGGVVSSGGGVAGGGRRRGTACWLYHPHGYNADSYCMRVAHLVPSRGPLPRPPPAPLAAPAPPATPSP